MVTLFTNKATGIWLGLIDSGFKLVALFTNQLYTPIIENDIPIITPMDLPIIYQSVGF